MVKSKTYNGQEISRVKGGIKVNGVLYKKMDPQAFILDKKNILKAIAECLQENDFKGILRY